MTSKLWTSLAIGALLLASAGFAQAQNEPPASETPKADATAEPSEEKDLKEARKPWVPAEKKWGGLFGEYSNWWAQPIGLNYVVSRSGDAVTTPSSPVLISHGTNDGRRYRVGYRLPKEPGQVLLTWWASEDKQKVAEARAGSFQFAEAHIPTSAGVFEDGMADAYDGAATTHTRDLRIDYYRTVLHRPAAEIDWFIGWRRVTHSRTLDVNYYALAPLLALPIEANPDVRADLAPRPDSATLGSDFEGDGLGSGVEMRFPCFKNRVWIEGGISAAVLRGFVASRFYSISSAYQYTEPSGATVPITDRETLATFFETWATGSSLRQVSIPTFLEDQRSTSDATVIEISLGVRARVWRGMEVLGGFRGSTYTSVAQELEADAGSSDGATRTSTSVSYEGYYLGVAYRY